MTPRGETRWQDVSEKGTVLGMRVLVALATRLGRGVARLALFPVAAWYVVAHPSVRRFSRTYLLRIGKSAGWLDVYAHVLCYARVTLDRLFLATGDLEPFEFSFEGEEHLRALVAARSGALLLLAHLGSFEALRALAVAREFTVSMLGDFRNAGRIQSILHQLNPSIDLRLISIGEDPTFVFKVQDRIAAGEMVGTMTDRVRDDRRAVPAKFLGEQALFPAGPFVLAAALGCPVLLLFGLYREPNRYDLYCERFAERLVLPHDRREAALSEQVARYAERLEEYCRRAPHNWFNFYDFWSAARAGHPEGREER
jgi:predicted LPLAT superfamily acyltransferase